MNKKLLKVYVNNKEIYNVIKQNKSYNIYDNKDYQIGAFTLDVNAYIYAIELGQKEGNGNCTAYYTKEQEKLIFEDYNLTMRISNLKRV